MFSIHSVTLSLTGFDSLPLIKNIKHGKNKDHFNRHGKHLRR